MRDRELDLGPVAEQPLLAGDLVVPGRPAPRRGSSRAVLAKIEPSPNRPELSVTWSGWISWKISLILFWSVLTLLELLPLLVDLSKNRLMSPCPASIELPLLDVGQPAGPVDLVDLHRQERVEPVAPDGAGVRGRRRRPTGRTGRRSSRRRAWRPAAARLSSASSSSSACSAGGWTADGRADDDHARDRDPSAATSRQDAPARSDVDRGHDRSLSWLSSQGRPTARAPCRTHGFLGSFPAAFAASAGRGLGFPSRPRPAPDRPAGHPRPCRRRRSRRRRSGSWASSARPSSAARSGRGR